MDSFLQNSTVHYHLILTIKRKSLNGPSHIKTEDYTFEGDLLNGKRHGNTFSLTFSSHFAGVGLETTLEGSYKGQFLDNLRSGYGLLVTNKGATYEGKHIHYTYRLQQKVTGK